MRRHLLLAALLPVVILGCPSETPAVCDNGACDPSPDGSPDGTSTGDAGPDGVATPEGCDPNADPKDAPKCVVNDFGIFVDATAGNDGNSGTKELPMKSIGGALTKLNGRPRIYVCEGTYPESVKLTTPISIFGGFACGTWAYTGNQPKVAPGVAGAEAFLIENVNSRIVLSDVHAEAAPGDATKKNSIAMRIVGSTDVKLVRVKVVAGAGFKGADGAAGATGTISNVSTGEISADGTPATGATGGGAKTCTCSVGGTGGNTTTGGSGGSAGGDGAGGSPKIGAPTDGKGGLGTVANCSPDGFGGTGASAPNVAAALSPTTSGQLLGAWEPTGGIDGADGVTGQGGGGGGSKDASNGGSGGGCGGCPGSGGKGGGGGGGSIALLLVDSNVTANASTFLAAAGGDGGTGGGGGLGALGGNPGNTGLCAGGQGGKGGNGGAGSGGAGGISAGILWKGTEPTRDDATNAAITVGAAGAAGVGGAPGMNDGPPGKAEKVMGL